MALRVAAWGTSGSGALLIRAAVIGDVRAVVRLGGVLWLVARLRMCASRQLSC